MVSQGPQDGETLGAISNPGEYSLESIGVGCRVWVTRPINEERKVEILSIRQRKKALYGPGALDPEDPADHHEFYVHYLDFNKRLDEWIPGSRVILVKELEWPKPKPPPAPKKESHLPPPKNKNIARKTNKKSKAASLVRSSLTPGPSGTPQKRKATPASFNEDTIMADIDMDEDGVGDEDAEGESVLDEDMEDVDGGGLDNSQVVQPSDPQKAHPASSKKQEIEKLRTSGSMTQNVHEVARVKNLNKLQIGKYLVESWYFSPYPVDFSHLPILYICEFCLSYYPSPMMFSRHRLKCQLAHPPGNEIYRHEDISFFEIDGKRQLTWCRNLSLLSKCFLDHKTLYYDVQPFMYYVMVKRDDQGCHILGYFSKEKESAESYNLACILTLPQHQRFGYGKLLIEFSYELSKREGKVGSPEKPLSDLGLLGYRAYWTETILDFLTTAKPEETTLDEISHRTCITPADIQYTLHSLQLLKSHRNSHIICITDTAKETYEKQRSKKRRRIEPKALQWKPPVFSRDQLRAWAY